MSVSKDRELERYRKALSIAHDALQFYADPENYHAIAFMADRPAGGFANDFDTKHGHDFYDRPMPGKTARKALKLLVRKYGSLRLTDI